MKGRNNMYYSAVYDSPFGEITLVCDENALKRLWFSGGRYSPDITDEEIKRTDTPLLAKTKEWLDRYFAGRRPDRHELPFAPEGSDFRKLVWDILLEIPYGEVTTYGKVAAEAAGRMGRKNMSAQAVGGAVGHNPISIVIPCHRVVGSSGSLTGYAEGIDKKIALLELEGADMTNLFVPKKGTAL